MRVRLATIGAFGCSVHKGPVRCGVSSLTDHAVNSGDDAVIATLNSDSKRADEISKELSAWHAAGRVVRA